MSFPDSIALLVENNQHILLTERSLSMPTAAWSFFVTSLLTTVLISAYTTISGQDLPLTNLNCTPSEIYLDHFKYYWQIPEGYYYSDTCSFTFYFANDSVLHCDYEADLRYSTIEIETSLGSTHSSKGARYTDVYALDPQATVRISLATGSTTYIKRISCSLVLLWLESDNIYGNRNVTLDEEPYFYSLSGHPYSRLIFEAENKKKMKIYLTAPPSDTIYDLFGNGAFFYINSSDPFGRPVSTMQFLSRKAFETEKFIIYTTRGGIDTEAELLFVDPEESYDYQFIFDWKERDKELILNATQKPVVICVGTYTDYRFNRGMFIAGVNITTPNTTLYVLSKLPYKGSINRKNILAAYNATEGFDTPHLFGGRRWTFALEKGEARVNISNQLRLPAELLNTTGIWGRIVNSRNSQDDNRPTMVEIPNTGIQMTVKIKKPNEPPNGGTNIWWEGSEGYLYEQETNFLIKSRTVYFGPINETVTLNTKSINVTLWPNESIEYHIVASGTPDFSSFLLPFVIFVFLPLLTDEDQ